jgi:hypothetical protein
VPCAGEVWPGDRRLRQSGRLDRRDSGAVVTAIAAIVIPVLCLLGLAVLLFGSAGAGSASEAA